MKRAASGWQVRVRWLPWTPPWRRPSRAWIDDMMVPVELGRRGLVNAEDSVLIAVALMLSVVVLFIAAMAMLADLAVTIVAVLVSALGHLVMRRPFLVEAISPAGEWTGWWVSGWRRARRARNELRRTSDGPALRRLRENVHAVAVPAPRG